jgi:hypothetical protein
MNFSELEKMLSSFGYAHLKQADLPYGVGVWYKRLGFWGEDMTYHEHLCVFLQEVEGLVMGVCPLYLRTHKTKNMTTWVLKEAKSLEARLDYKDLTSLKEVESLMRTEIAVKRIDRSEAHRV